MPEVGFSKPAAGTATRDSNPGLEFQNKFNQLKAVVEGDKATTMQSTTGTTEKAAVEYKSTYIDRQAYLRSLLAQERFEKTYTIFGGVVKVTFVTRKVSENAVIDGIQDRFKKRKAQLEASIKQLELCGDNGQVVDTLILRDYDAAISNTGTTLSRLDDTMYSAVCSVFVDFEQICLEMFERANDPDFWTRTGGVV